MSFISGYQSWHSMIRRCCWIGHKDYARYGGSGITVDPRWQTYRLFIEDMGPRPRGTTLDRKDNSLGYFKENCRWATLSEQNSNRGKPRSNTSGCLGVSWQTKQGKWLVSRMKNGQRYMLYWGLSLFEAACAAKSWENRTKEHCK